MDIRRPPLAGGALRWLGRSESLSRVYHLGAWRSPGGVKGGARPTTGLFAPCSSLPCGEPARKESGNHVRPSMALCVTGGRGERELERGGREWGECGDERGIDLVVRGARVSILKGSNRGG